MAISVALVHEDMVAATIARSYPDGTREGFTSILVYQANYHRAGASPPKSADAAQGELDEALPACHRAHAAGHAHEPQNEAGES